MQQTTKYKLDLIEKDDVFSPDALNENTQKLEAALAAETAARAAETAARQEADAALDARVTVLEAKKIVIGHYQGDGTASRFFDLGFTPIAVFVFVDDVTKGSGNLSVTGHSARYGNMGPQFDIMENGFQVYKSDYAIFNFSGRAYNYIAFG